MSDRQHNRISKRKIDDIESAISKKIQLECKDVQITKQDEKDSALCDVQEEMKDNYFCRINQESEILINMVKDKQQEETKDNYCDMIQESKIIDNNILNKQEETKENYNGDDKCDEYNFTNMKVIHIQTDNTKAELKCITTTVLGQIETNVVIEMLKRCKGVSDVKQSIPGHKYDIQYFVGSHQHGIQVKKLTQSGKKRPNSFYIRGLDAEYDPNTLIIGMNEEYKKVVMLFCRDAKQEKITFTFNGQLNPRENQKWKQDMIVTWLDWEKGIKLTELCGKSVIIDSQRPYLYLSLSQRKEFWMIQRFVQMLISKGIQLEYITRPAEDDSVTDLYVKHNNILIKFQLKSSASILNNAKNPLSYSFGITKSRQKVSYEENDNDYYVFEIITKDLCSQFLIVDQQFLIKKGYIKTSRQNGKTGLEVFPLEFNEKMKEFNKQKLPGPSLLRGNWTNLATWYSKDDSNALPWCINNDTIPSMDVSE